MSGLLGQRSRRPRPASLDILQYQRFSREVGPHPPSSWILGWINHGPWSLLFAFFKLGEPKRPEPLLPRGNGLMVLARPYELKMYCEMPFCFLARCELGEEVAVAAIPVSRVNNSRPLVVLFAFWPGARVRRRRRSKGRGVHREVASRQEASN